MSNSESINDSASDPDRAPRRISKEDLCSISTPTISNERKRPKKAVRFVAMTSVYRLGIPCASDMSSREKKRLWYDCREHDRMKCEAGADAGVKIVRCESQPPGRGHHFIMVGDFDGAGDGTGECRYNENEYNDRADAGVCKRGLGYHFSRARKKARVVARSAVVAWQKILRDPSNRSNLRLLQQGAPTAGGGGSGKQQIDKTQMMLAVVSTKSSRVSREEAKWRGKVDYKVAHPERHVRSQKDRNTALLDVVDRVGDFYSSSLSGPKRRTDEVDTLCPANNCGTSSKKRRTGHGCSDRDVLSPETIAGYLSGVLHAEV
ncbi:hypothetical protein ACHAXT_005944 [Thalassiosira profunda]